MPDAGFGIYVHWPFCQAKCPYCDFNSHVVPNVDDDLWARAFERELDRHAELTGGRVVNSVFFGGGTPSLMTVETVDRIMARIGKHWRIANDFEVTLEANPTSTEAERFDGYFKAGVNRISVGVQALNDADLKRLGRLHSTDEALKAVDTARSIFDRVSFDLIYARQDQTVSDWEDELRRALEFGPDHLSLYQLTIEDGTAFGDRFKVGKLRGLPDEDLGADLWDVTQEFCTAAGLPAYEISNHARLGKESRHNLIYWNSGDWIGIGPGAHGRLTIDGLRYETVSARAPNAWIERINKLGNGETLRSALNEESQLEERLLMGLRLTSGIEMPESWISNKQFIINDLVEIGLLVNNARTLQATAEGRPLLNSIIEKLLAY